jgi:hypothetical protein
LSDPAEWAKRTYMAVNLKMARALEWWGPQKIHGEGQN